MNYGFGTAILSGMMLINPYIALRTFILIGLSGMVAKLIALWLLSVYPDIETRGKEEAEKQMLPNNSENASAIPVAEA
jgi:hypothetical protein